MSVPARVIPTNPGNWRYRDSDVSASIFDAPVTIGVPTNVIDIGSFFNEQSAQWKRETAHLSLVSQRVTHPAYLRILMMGRLAIPYILADLQDEPDHWFHALSTLTGARPIPYNFSGTITDAAQLWIDWGRNQGYLDNAAPRITWHLP